MADPLSLTTGIISLITLAIKLVVGATGLIDKTVAAHREAVNELQRLQQDLERLERQMDEIHGTLQFLVANTKDRAFKNLLQDNYGKISVRKLCSALDETFAVLERLTDRAKAEKTNLQSIALPTNVKSLGYVQAVLKHSFTPSKTAHLVDGLRVMQSEIQTCLEKLEGSLKHVNHLYNFAHNRLVRVVTATSIDSTSTMLTARIKLAGWLKRREGTWGLSSRGRSTTLNDFLDTDTLIGMPPMVPEILKKILIHLCDDGPIALRHVLFTSKWFYNATVNDAELWTTINLDTEFFKYFGKRPAKQASGFMMHCLHRSGALPLCICIENDELFDAYHLGILELFTIPKYRAFERCTSLIWKFASWSDIPKTMALLPKELPSLRSLSLSSFVDPTDGSQFPICPLLETVVIMSHRGSYPSFWGTSFAHVTTLILGHNSVWGSYNITTLSLFPILQDLTLFTKGALGWRTDWDSVLPVQINSLRILRVHGCVRSVILTKLVVPALEELHLKAGDQYLTPIAALESDLNPFCRHLFALLPKAVVAQEPAWAMNLSKLVQKCTRLETLSISKWMEKKCKVFMGGSNVVLCVSSSYEEDYDA